jgi:hypothetical protein
MAEGQYIGPVDVLSMSFKVASGSTITGYQVVKIGTNGGEVALASAATDIPLGIAQVNPQQGMSYGAGREVTVRMLGISHVVATTAVTSGNRVSVISGTGAVKGSGAAGDLVVGIALESSWTTGELITVLLTPGAIRHA